MLRPDGEKSRSWTLLAAAGCLSLILAAGAITWFRTAHVAVPATAHPRDDDLREQIKKLDRHVRLLRARQVASERSWQENEEVTFHSEQGDNSSRRDAEDLPTPQEITPEEAKAQASARYAFLDDSFRSEERDPVWSKEVESDIFNTLQRERFEGVRLQTASCASTMCKIEVLLESDSSFAEFQTEFVQALGPYLPRGSMKHDQNGDGSVAVTAYLARPEARLPRWEPPED